jgi:hypothetical protein
MTRHYQDSTIFNWLRDRVFRVEKPYALPWGGWEKWEKEYKETRPVAFFITETLPDWLEKPGEWFVDPVYSAKYYLRNRFITKTHVLKTGLEPGKWHEFENRVLHGLFTELVDFVEIEQAWHHVMWDEDARKKFGVKWYHHNQWTRWAEWRCPEAGLAYLQWCMNLDEPEHQRDNARETMVLYTWWKEVYLTRKEEWEETGLRAFWDSMEFNHGDDWIGLGKKTKMTRSEQAEYQRLTQAVTDLEEARFQEENDMMIRLIKLRRGLWT